MTIGSVILVTYNSAGSIESCLRALRLQPDAQEWQRIVVDNASLDDTVARAQAADPDARLIRNPRNLGFAAAANLGAQAAAGRILLFLNPDAIPAPGALQELARALDSEGAGAAGGLLLRPDNQPDRGFVVRRFPTVPAMAAEILLLNRLWPGNPINRRYRCLDLDYAQAQNVEQPAGACLALTREAFAALGGFDESFFPVWFEDVDLCLRLRARGSRIVYCPRAVFTHSGGHSVNKLPLADRQLFWYRNLLRYFRKHKGPAAVGALRACIGVGMGLRSLAALLGLAPRDSGGARAALRAYGAVARECVLPAGPVKQPGAPIKVAILGTRGIPARYGGFETLADQLSRRLAARGHQVTVYCRRPFTSPADVVDPRVRRVILPTISHKYFDTAFHTFLSAIHVCFTDADVVFFCNVANSPWAWIPRLFGKPTVLNVDGLDRKRGKWNALARGFLGMCEALATFTPTSVVTDARLIQAYYKRRFNKDSVVISYGAEVPPCSDRLEGFDQLTPRKFILYVSRLEPENNPALVIDAYRNVQTDWPLVMVGGNPYDPAFVARLKSRADPRVVFPGGVYGPGYWQLLQNAGLYVFACEVGGVHPALVEAMAAGNTVLYLDTPENRDTAGDGAASFQPDAADLAAHLARLLADVTLRDDLSRRARRRAEAAFNWEAVTNSYESLFRELLGA